MLIATDVQYGVSATVTAVVGFRGWADADPALECVVRSDGAPAAYEPGRFAKRELPFLLEAVGRVQARHPVEVVVVDGHVWLDEGRPGLGARLHEALGDGTAVVGVAKAPFEAGTAIPVHRGGSTRPLFVSAVGIEAEHAAALVREMHGPHRLPTLLKRADHLARGHAPPDPAKGVTLS